MLIYVASPYSHPDESKREERYYAAMTYVLLKMKQTNNLYYSPITYCHVISVLFDLPKGFEFWQSINHAAIDKCDLVEILQLEGWKESKGIADEIGYANSINKPIEYVGVPQYEY